MTDLKAQPPKDLQENIGDVAVRVSRVHQFLVHDTPLCATEIAALLKHILMQGGPNAQLNGNDHYTSA